MNAQARADCEQPVGRFVDIKGSVETQAVDGDDWLKASLDSSLCEGSSIRVGAQSRAAINLVNDAVLRLDENTTMRLVDVNEKEEERSLLDIIKGALHSFSRKPKKLSINSPYLNGSIEGTEFVFRVTGDQSEVTVFEGTVVAANDQGSVSVSGGEAASARQGQAPQSRTVVQPRNAAQWSLYYPPILATGGDQATDVSPQLRQAAADLSVGRVDEARTTLDQLIAEDTDAGLAYALRAVINVVQNQPEQALNDANQAVELNPDSAATYIALSYAQQAGFQINEARDTLLLAVEKQPEDALAWARLAELRLMLGDRQQSSDAAQKAVELAPDLGRTQITLGFAALAEFRTADARKAFEKAITLDSADPLPHLGLGLARISAGELEQGRSEIEVAVGLGSNNALLRAYLGKAYFEEKRAPLDSEQLEIASQLDPMDPTPYLYAGIAKQTENRPVEALDDLEKSIELNDNRAAYRSRLLLDKDRAARGASLARAYNDLGFKQPGINEATNSLTIDPSNASAHRFLSDTYRGMRRRETARVSELLQAQLLQEVNVNPVQPSNSETNLNSLTIGGPASPGFNEFTPLFQRNKLQLNATGFVGNNDTSGGEAVATAVYDQFSISAGAYTYDTDGWRSNNDVSQDIYNIYTQWAVTPDLNIQAEYRSKDSTEGDLAFNFDPDDFFEDLEIDRDRDTARLGLRYSPAPKSNILFSYIYSDNEQKNKQIVDFDPVTNLFIDEKGEDDGNQVEVQYIYDADKFDLIVGGANYDIDRKLENGFRVEVDGVGTVFEDNSEVNFDIKQPRGYVYSNINQTDAITWTVGASYDDYEEDVLDKTSFNPKLGLQWDISDSTRLRAAAFKILKPALTSNRTIEPTQVAGFNQFFDDVNGTRSWRYGVGFDTRVNKNLFVGGEASYRELETPVFFTSATGRDSDIEDSDEELYSLYLNWTPLTQLGVTAEIRYDRYDSDDGLRTEFGNLPEEVDTFSVPLGVTYYNSSGFFAGTAGTYVNQDVNRSDSSIQADGDDTFFLVDALIGYRFSKRMGVASLGAKNLFDKDFKYQDDSYREFQDEPSTGPYFPERTIMGQLTLNF